MKLRKVFACILATVFLCSLYGCGSKPAEGNKNEDTTKTPVQTAPTTEKSTADNSAQGSSTVNKPDADTIVFDDRWNYAEKEYSESNEEALKFWEEFKEKKDSGAAARELLPVLSEVVARDNQFVPGYVEYARYLLIDYYEDGGNLPPSNAMNCLTEGYYRTGDPVFLELKKSLGWDEISKILDQANNALKEGNAPEAWRLIGTLPEPYANILEAIRIRDILNKFDDSYYYLILGPALGNQYIVHFQIDGTYERVKMNEDGIYDTGTWESNILSGYSISFAGLSFHDRGDAFVWVDHDSNGNTYEYEMRLSADGRAKEQFVNIASLEPEVSDVVAVLTANKWQVEEGWYYQFNDNGTGVISRDDNSYSYNFTYFEDPEKENTIIIRPSDMPEDYSWIYDPAKESFKQESYGYDMTTDTAHVFYAEVYVYNG